MNYNSKITQCKKSWQFKNASDGIGCIKYTWYRGTEAVLFFGVVAMLRTLETSVEFSGTYVQVHTCFVSMIVIILHLLITCILL